MNATSLKVQGDLLPRMVLQGEGATARLAEALAALCKAEDCLLLSGEVGAGKTTFARAFIRSLSPQEGEILSPTFTLVQTYPLPAGNQLWHFDLYRIRQEEELLEIGLEDALASGITLIEWPDIARFRLPPSALDIGIDQGDAPDERCFAFRSVDDKAWSKRLQLLKGVA